MMPTAHRQARLPQPAHRRLRPGDLRAFATVSLPHYPGTWNERLHNADRLQKPCSAPVTFDFSNPEARLLLIRFPLFAQAPEFADFPHPRLTPLRILTNWGLTNGINGVMIDCMHGVTHSPSRHFHAPSRSGSRAAAGARERMLGTCGAGGCWRWPVESRARELV
jgi:hypothetical protein